MPICTAVSWYSGMICFPATEKLRASMLRTKLTKASSDRICQRTATRGAIVCPSLWRYRVWPSPCTLAQVGGPVQTKFTSHGYCSGSRRKETCPHHHWQQEVAAGQDCRQTPTDVVRKSATLLTASVCQTESAACSRPTRPPAITGEGFYSPRLAESAVLPFGRAPGGRVVVEWAAGIRGIREGILSPSRRSRGLTPDEVPSCPSQVCTIALRELKYT